MTLPALRGLRSLDQHEYKIRANPACPRPGPLEPPPCLQTQRLLHYLDRALLWLPPAPSCKHGNVAMIQGKSSEGCCTPARLISLPTSVAPGLHTYCQPPGLHWPNTWQKKAWAAVAVDPLLFFLSLQTPSDSWSPDAKLAGKLTAGKLTAGTPGRDPPARCTSCPIGFAARFLSPAQTVSARAPAGPEFQNDEASNDELKCTPPFDHIGIATRHAQQQVTYRAWPPKYEPTTVLRVRMCRRDDQVIPILSRDGLPLDPLLPCPVLPEFAKASDQLRPERPGAGVSGVPVAF